MFDPVDLDRKLVEKGGLYDFVEMSWHVVEPSNFVGNWHLGLICEHLEAVSLNQIDRLIINQPPSTGKSILTGVFWNVWEWILRPSTKWFYVSYDPTLVGTRDGGKVVRLLQSEWFKDRWGNLLPRTAPALSNFDNVHGGYRFSTGMKGKGTGRHADIQVIDDPIKPKDVTGGSSVTKKELRFASEHLGGTLASRAVNPPTFRRVLVMQRLHDEDPSGEMINTGRWVHLRLPMAYDRDRPCKTSVGGDPRTTEGALLFPERFPAGTVETLKAELGPDPYAAQYQQTPTRKGGKTFRREWFRFWHMRPDVPDRFCPVHAFDKCTCDTPPPVRMCNVLPLHGLDIQSWDCAFKGKDTSDFVAGGLFRVSFGRVFLVDCTNERLSFTLTLAAIKAMTVKFPKALDKLIEEAANGAAVIDTLRIEIRGITPVDALGGKEARAAACTPLMAMGNYFLPHPDIAPWVKSYMVQLEAFPNGVNDDMVDMTSQALLKLRAHGNTFSEAMAAIRMGMK